MMAFENGSMATGNFLWPRFTFSPRFLARARAAPRPAVSIGGAGAQLWGLFGASRSKPLAEGWLWRVCALAFQAG